MQTITYTAVVSRAGWPSGPWDNEPDKTQWPDPTTGLACLAVRHSSSGHWCGYVGVPAEHPFHGKGYNDLYEADIDLEVHGGLTFSDGCSKSADPSKGICHVPDAGEPDDVWWFGFDCAHCYDLQPGLQHLRSFASGRDVYCTLEYVQFQCQELARQLAAVVAPSAQPLLAAATEGEVQA